MILTRKITPNLGTNSHISSGKVKESITPTASNDLWGIPRKRGRFSIEPLVGTGKTQFSLTLVALLVKMTLQTFSITILSPLERI